ncbi:MAG: RNA methyltransferase [Mycoplasmatales bacterium]|nr:RNA methyltransferase [Mycoplasmatales bacterium]
MIKSSNNKRIKEIAKLKNKKYRNKEKMFLVEGFHLIEEAKKKDLVIEIFTTDENIEGTLVSNEVIKKISSTETPQPVVALVKKIKTSSLGNKVLVLNNLQDPGNVGTLIRSAVAFDFSGVIVQGVDFYNSKCIRSSQGAIFQIPILQTNDIKNHFDDYQLIGSILDKNAKHYKDIKIKNKFMLILGNEGQGIEKEIIDLLDEKVYIPIKFESLNVASAGAILLNEYKN